MEGGMRVPFIARHPGTLPAGKTCRELATMMDVLPTFAGLAGATLPRNRAIDGKDIVSLLLHPETARTPYNAFFYYFMGQLQAVRAGNWKLHLRLKKKQHGWHQPPYEERGQLYDLEADPSESVNLFDQHAEVVARLTALADAARADIGDEDRKGANERPAGWVAEAQPLTLARPR
jgi:arylsulfatase A-like enzyme